MEEEWDGDQRRDIVHVHDSGGNHRGQQCEIHRRSEQRRGQRNQQRRRANRDERDGGSGNHNATGKPDNDRRKNGIVHRRGCRNSANDVSVEQERRGDQRCDIRHLHDSGRNDHGQQREIHRRREQRAGSATSNAAILIGERLTLLLNSSASSLSFGNVNVSSTGTQTVTLTNAGNSSVTISNVTVSGAGFNASGVSSGLILTPGQTATLTATFTPASAGSVKGSVSVASNATNSPDSIALSGTGVAAVNHSVALSWSPSTSTVIGYNTYSRDAPAGRTQN